MDFSLSFWPPRIRVKIPTSVYVTVAAVAFSAVGALAYGHVTGEFRLEITHHGFNLTSSRPAKSTTEPAPTSAPAAAPSTTNSPTAVVGLDPLKKLDVTPPATAIPVAPEALKAGVGSKGKSKKARKTPVGKKALKIDYGNYYSSRNHIDPETGRFTMLLEINRCRPGYMPIACYMPEERRKNFVELAR